MRDLLIYAIRYELKDLQVVFPLGFHAVNAVPEYYLSDERHGVCYAFGGITLIVEHTFSPLPDTKKWRCKKQKKRLHREKSNDAAFFVV